MSVRVDWGDADEIILVWKFSKKWTWSDIRSSLNESKYLIEDSSQDVVLMVDLRQVKTHPNGMLHYLPQLMNQLPQEIIRVIFIDKGTIFYSLFQMMTFQDPDLMDKLCLVDNVDEAYNKVNQAIANAI
jgi:hypothetical protein